MKQTTVSMTLSRNNNQDVTLQIKDSHSGDRMMNITLSTSELGLLVTGLSDIKGKCQVYEFETAKKCITERVKIGCNTSDKNDRKNLVTEDFHRNYKDLGWIIYDYGLSSQQKSDSHNYIIRRYEPVNDPFDVEKYY